MGGADGPKIFTCPHPGCDKRFNRPSRVQTHLRIHTGERPFQCDLCEKAFTRKAHLLRHKAVNHPCDVTDDDAKQEKTTTTPQLHSCKDCEKTFTLVHNLRKHVHRFHVIKQYACAHCSAAFRKHRQLRQHSIQQHAAVLARTAGEDEHSCPECGKRLMFRSQLRRHQRVHRGHQCDKCDVKLERWSDLLQHRAIHRHHQQHQEVGEQQQQQHECATCHKQFRNTANLRSHQQVHSETRDVFHCPEALCPRYFYFLKNLQQHLASYHEGRRFSCTAPGCQQKLSSKQKLQEHITALHSAVSDSSKRKRKRPRRPQKDRGCAKKAMAAVLTGVEVTSGQRSLLQEGQKRPLASLDTIRSEFEAFVGSNSLESSDSEAGAVSLGGCRRGNSAHGRRGDTAHASKKESSDSEVGTVFGCRRRIALAQKRDSDSPDSVPAGRTFTIGTIRRYKRNRFFKKLPLPLDPERQPSEPFFVTRPALHAFSSELYINPASKELKLNAGTQELPPNSEEPTDAKKLPVQMDPKELRQDWQEILQERTSILCASEQSQPLDSQELLLLLGSGKLPLDPCILQSDQFVIDLNLDVYEEFAKVDECTQGEEECTQGEEECYQVEEKCSQGEEERSQGVKKCTQREEERSQREECIQGEEECSQGEEESSQGVEECTQREDEYPQGKEECTGTQGEEEGTHGKKEQGGECLQEKEKCAQEEESTQGEDECTQGEEECSQGEDGFM